MGRALHILSVFIQDAFHAGRHITAVRLHDLDFISDTELIALFNGNQTAILRRIHNAEINRLADVGAVIIDLGFFRGPSEEKSGIELPVGAFSDFMQVPVHVSAVIFFSGEIIVDRLPVGSRHRRHIERRLHPALHLEAVDSGINQLRNMPDHAEIAGIENVSSPLIFIDRKIFSRPALLHHRIFPAAGMGTRALVGIPPGKIIAQKAASGIGDAHGAVHKAFDLHLVRNVGPDFRKLCERQLPGGHHPLRSQLPPETVGHVIGIVGLGGNMNLRFRPYLFCQGKHARI